MMEDTPEKLRYLRAFSRWIDYGCRPAPGLAGASRVTGLLSITVTTILRMRLEVWMGQLT